MTRFTRNTIGTAAEMAIYLAEVRLIGYAIDDEEIFAGPAFVAAAVLNEHSEPIGAISISGPAIRVARERLPQLGSLVRLIASELTLELGGRRPASTPRDAPEAPSKRIGRRAGRPPTPTTPTG